MMERARVRDDKCCDGWRGHGRRQRGRVLVLARKQRYVRTCFESGLRNLPARRGHGYVERVRGRGGRGRGDEEIGQRGADGRGVRGEEGGDGCGMFLCLELRRRLYASDGDGRRAHDRKGQLGLAPSTSYMFGEKGRDVRHSTHNISTA